MPTTGPAASNMGSRLRARVRPVVDPCGQRSSRISTTTTTTTITASAGITRFRTGAPAVRSRSTGSASGASIVRGPSEAAGAADVDGMDAAGPADAVEEVDADGVEGVDGGGAAGAASGFEPDSTSRSRLSTNWPSNLLDTSPITPRPNCETLPVIVTSLSIVTRVPASSGTRTAVTVADALPCPRVSRPSARITARWLASSFSVKCALPLYCAVIGPTLTLTMPRNSSPSTSWSCAPGMHGAMRSTSVSTRQASSTGTSTRNSSWMFIGPPPGRARPRRHSGHRAYRRRRRCPCQCSRPRPRPRRPAAREHRRRRRAGAPRPTPDAPAGRGSVAARGTSPPPASLPLDTPLRAAGRRPHRPAAGRRARCTPHPPVPRGPAPRGRRAATAPSRVATGGRARPSRPREPRRSPPSRGGRRRAQPGADRCRWRRPTPTTPTDDHAVRPVAWERRPRGATRGRRRGPRSRRPTVSTRRDFERAPDEDTREVLSVLGCRVDVGGRLGPVRRLRGGFLDGCAAGERLFDGDRPERRPTHVHERDTRRAVPDRHRADDRPVLRPALELLVREPTRRLRDSDLGEQLVGLEDGLEEPVKELGRADSPFTTRSPYDEHGVEREQQCGQIRRRVAVRNRSADRSPVAPRVVANPPSHRP